MAKITVKLYDRKTQFNDVDVETINRVWGTTPYVLVYKDGEFSGIAQPKGMKSLEEWQAYFEAQEAENMANEAKASSEQSQLDTIEANTSYLVMMAEMESEAL